MDQTLAGAKNSFAFLRPYKRRIIMSASCLFLVGSIIGMLHDVEYTGQDVSVRGLRIFTWLKNIVPPQFYSHGQAPATFDDTPLFAHGIESLRPNVIVQGGVYDCRFLATVASFIATDAGRKALFKGIVQNDDGSFSVSFPSLKEPIHVSKLSNEEHLYYAKTKDLHGKSAGIWLAVLEKAYGQYRNQHQDLLWQIRRCAKHIIFEGRFSADSRLPGFAAAYGATDNQAAELFSTRALVDLKTFSYECGDYGFGKDYATIRQLSSWFNREQVKLQFANEQDAALRKGSLTTLFGIASTELNGNSEAYGLMPGHAYGVLSYNREKKLIKLKDPFGKGDLHRLDNNAALDGVDDGIFEIGLTDFNALFSHLRLAQ